MSFNTNRSISIVESELSLYGPKDSFIEDINTNLELIKKRIVSSNLKIEELFLGKYTNTHIQVLYMDSIIKKDLVHHILKRLYKISIDGVIDSSYLKHVLENDFHIFPTIMMSERPDRCSMALLEGKCVILVDNSPYSLILPNSFFDFFHTTDDYYQKSFNTSFIRIIRFIAFLISIYIPAFYLSVTTRDYSLIPFPLLLILKAGRSNVPFPAPIEAIFMILSFEILKESDLRMSSKNGSAISILGGLILGDAAVAAGIVSPIMILVIAISSIAGLIFPSIELGNALRFYKIFFLFLSSFFGIYGILFCSIFLLYDLLSTEIFGYSYFTFEWWDNLIFISLKNKVRGIHLSNNHIRGRLK